MKNTQTQNGFTLIELLVVIAIIALLAGLLFPAVTSSLNTAKKTKARSTCQNIETAIMAYSSEYGGRLPISSYKKQDEPDSVPSEADSKNILSVLMNNNNSLLNTKKIVFLETDVPSNDGTYLDPWGHQYIIKLDDNLDGKIEYYTKDGAHHRKKAIVISRGKDRELGTKDDIANVDLPLLN